MPELSPRDSAMLVQLVSNRSMETIGGELLRLGYARIERLKMAGDLVRPVFVATRAGKLAAAEIEAASEREVE